MIYLVIVPLFTFYFLIDYKKITSFFKDLVPPRHREKVLSILGDIDDVLAGFIRGQGTVCFILAVVYSIALSIAGVPAGVTVGVVAGLFNFVPYLGTALGVILSCVFLLLEGAGAVSYAAVGGIFLVVNILDGLFLTPRILGKKLGLAPVAVILAIMAFSELFGFLGVLMAVPLTAIGKVLGKRVIETYRQSRAFSNKKEAPGHQDSGPVDNEEDQASSE